MNRILVVDDERAVLRAFERALQRNAETIVVTADTAAAGLAAVQRGDCDAVVLDVMLPDMSGLELFSAIRAIDPHLPVVFITAGGSSGSAIEAMQRGALDYLTKPLDFTEVRDIVEKAFRNRKLMVESVDIDPVQAGLVAPGEALIGRCPQMQLVYKAIGRVAAQNVTVLIRGESGTGKELIARALYQHSNRREKPFLAVNCAAIPETLLESELFGHEKGAFTGAERQHIGKFEQCNGGTLFLDEIGDMQPLLQSKLLRILQEQRFERVGGSATIETDVRVIAATNRDMEKMVAENEFRGDLYYRLNGYAIFLPPLRERQEDLILLVEHFLAAANRDYNKPVRGVAPETMMLLRTYSWPGNIRELQSVIRQAVLDTSGPIVFPESLPQVITRSLRADAHDPSSPLASFSHWVHARLASGSHGIYDEAIELVERPLIGEVLKSTGGNQGEAAQRLGITRTTLRSKLRKLGLAIERVVNEEEDQDGTPPPVRSDL